jgi:PKD repeat protein
VVSHAYVTSGTFDVSLMVSNTHGVFTVSKPGYIAVMEKGKEPSYFVYLPLVMRSYEPPH